MTGVQTCALPICVLIGDDKLRAEGKTDQAVGEVKEVVQNVADSIKDAVKKVSGNTNRLVASRPQAL